VLQQCTNDITRSDSLQRTHECLQARGQNTNNSCDTVNSDWKLFNFILFVTELDCKH